MDELDRRASNLAAGQHGLITVQQAAELGGDRNLPRRRVASGHWRRCAPGVYVVGGAPATFEREVLAAVMAAGPGAVASHRTAARLWGLVPPSERILELSIPVRRRHVRTGVVVHRSSDLELGAITRIAGIPVTGAARTLLDLGAVAPGRLRRATWVAPRERATAWDVLLRTCVRHGRRGRAGVGALRALLAEHYGERTTDSTTEDLAFEILVDSGLVPVPEKQVVVTCADGVEVTVDFGWPRYRALLEVFGVDHLTNEDLAHLDLHRRNQIELAGYRLLTYSGRLLRRQPDQFVRDVALVLTAGGWSGVL